MTFAFCQIFSLTPCCIEAVAVTSFFGVEIFTLPLIALRLPYSVILGLPAAK